MAGGMRIEGSVSGNLAEVDASNNLLVKLPTASTPALVGAIGNYSVVDDGLISGTPYLLSAEVDDDYRIRIAPEVVFDMETFNYTAQNTGKFIYRNSVLTNAWAVGNVSTNSANNTAIGGTSLVTYAFFPLLGAGTLYCEMEGAFNNQPVTNTAIDFGMFLNATTTPFAPTDGAFFRLTSAGLSGVINYNGTETTTAVFSFTYTNSRKYQFIIAITEREVEFWIDGNLYATLDTPIGQGQPFASASLPFAVRHAIVGGVASAALSFQLADYTISVGGPYIGRSLAEMGNAIYGSYQGLSGGAAMGSLASYANSANPTAAVPTNTTSTVIAASLGGQGWETDTLAVTTDGIICSYPVPAGTASVQGRRLRINGVAISSFVQTALTGGGYVAQYSLAFGHTTVSLATAEAATTKAPRRIALGVQQVASGSAATTVLATVTQTFQNPVYVNPGEFVAIVKKKVGTAPSAGVIGHVITFDYAWE